MLYPIRLGGFGGTIGELYERPPRVVGPGFNREVMVGLLGR